jgi:phosphoribosylanthranilate isomerase
MQNYSILPSSDSGCFLSKLRVKICGMRDSGNIAKLSKLPIDMMGFIFYPQSPRYAGNLSPRSLSIIPANICKVGVFVNETVSTILSIAQKYELQMIQLHGTESADSCRLLRDQGYKVIKAFNVSSGKDFNFSSAYADVSDYFLFDTQSSSFGGSGKQYNWKILDDYKEKIPFFLSGGIGIMDKERVREFNHDQLYAIDLNSKFEISPGIKNIELIHSMIQ